MKIIHILTDSNVGGAGILLESLLRHTGLPKEDICVILPRGAAMAERYAALGVRVLPTLSCPDRSFALRDLPRLFRIMRQERPTVVHTHAALGGRIAAALARVPVPIATRHCAYPVGIRGTAPFRFLNRLADTLLCRMTVATAEAAAANLRDLGIPAEKICLIRNGGEALTPLSPVEKHAARAALGISEGDFVLGMSARLVRVKGQDTLLDAAELLLSRHTGYRFLFVGGGEDEKRLRRRVAGSPLAEHVLFVGEVRDVAPYVNLFDVAVNCSSGTETSCLALSEAMSLGIPCIASDFGGNTEMIRQGENGLLFPVGDAAALGDRIMRLRGDPALYRRLCAGARRLYMTSLRAEMMAAEYDRLYERLAAEATAAKRKRPLFFRAYKRG